MPSPSHEPVKSQTYLIVFSVIAAITILLLGYIDYLTGEVSLDMFYMLSIGLVTWYTNRFLGVLCIIEVLLVKISADYFCQVKVGTHLYEWNSFNDIIMYAIVLLLVAKLKKVLTD